MGKQYKAVLIGHTGQGNYGHGLDMVYSDMPEVDVVAVADPDDEGLAAAAQRTGATRPYAEYRCLLYTSPSPRDATLSRMPSSA